MDRTRFLKTFSLMAAGSFLVRQPAMASLAQAAPEPRHLQERRFRGAEEGRILVSEDAGATWKVHSQFGPAFTILNILEGPRETYSLVDFKGLHFKLKLSADGRSWVTP